jgi:hypothetical protein
VQKNRIILIIAAVLMLNATTTLAADYYVATGGNDSNPGTLASPWATIQHAADTVSDGDTVYIRGGKYHEVVTIDSLNGSPGSPITFMNYNSEDVIISGTLPVTGPWSVHSGSIYKTTIGFDTFQLFVDDNMMTAARWPNIQKDWDEPDNSNGYDPTPGSYWDMDTTQGHITSDSNWGHFYNDDSFNDLGALGVSVQGAMIVGYRCMVTGNDVFAEQITSHTAGTSDFTHTTETHPLGSTESQPASDSRYYIESDLDLLDSPGEWFYDMGTGILYVWMDNSGSPTGRNIEARVVEHAVLELNNCSFLNFIGLTLFAGAFDLNGTSDTSFEDCRFLYSSYGRRMLKVIKPALGHVIHDFSAPYNRVQGATPGNLTWRDCEFANYEGIGLYIRTDGGNLLENCYFHNGQIVQTNYGAVSDRKGSGTTIRRCTFHTLGLANSTKCGPDSLIEYCHSYNFMFQGDFSVHQTPQNNQMTAINHHNWAIDAKGRNGIRFDGDPAGIRGLVHHVVCSNTDRGFRIKGDQHHVYNLTAIGNQNVDLNIAFEKFYGYDPNDCFEFACRIEGRRGSHPYHGNENSIAHNLAADVITNWPLTIIDPANKTAIWHGNDIGKELESQLRDSVNLDFRPKADSDLVDGGTIVPTITDGFVGAAPDIGAYEYNEPNYWIPGCQFEKAVTPIPHDGSTTARDDADLMWLGGKDALSHNVYFGAVSGSLLLQGNQTTNIFDPGPLTIGQQYFWRIDTVTPSETITGDEWTFTPALYSGGGGTESVTLNPIADSYVQDGNQADDNYGTETTLELRTPAISGVTRQAYVKFNVAVGAPIVEATLRLYSSNTLSGGVYIHGVTDNSWTENGITWNNRPAMEASSMANATPNGGYADMDVTSWITGDGIFSLGLVRGAKDSNRRAQSRESDNPPELVITYAEPPANNPPFFNSTSFGAPDATAGEPYSFDISSEATDPDPGDILTFSKQAGPAWLNIDPNGYIWGTPAAGDAGVNSWTVQVEDGNGGNDQASMSITVLPGGNNPDINGDGYINFEDFEIIASYWLTPCSAPGWCEGADLDVSGLVDFQDVNTLAQNWLTLP